MSNCVKKSVDLMHVLLLVFYAKSFSKTSQYQPDIFQHLWYHILGVPWDEYDWIWAFELTSEVIIFWKHELKSILSWKDLSTWVKKSVDFMHVLLAVFHGRNFSKTSQCRPDFIQHLWYHILGFPWDVYDWIRALELIWKVTIFWKHE